MRELSDHRALHPARQKRRARAEEVGWARAVTLAVVKGGGDQRDKQSARERARKGSYFIHIHI